jgi:hypothetical protein
VLLDEQRPVATARGSRCPKVPEVPGEDEGLSCLSHGHHHGVSQIQARCFVPLEKLEGTTMLRVRRAIEDMRAVKQRVREDEGPFRVPSGAQHEVNFDVDWPGDDYSTAEC